MKTITPRSRGLVVVMMLGLFFAGGRNCFAADSGGGPLSVSDGHHTVSLTLPAGFKEGVESTAARRVLIQDGGKATLLIVLLPADQPTDPAAAAAVIDASAKALQQSLGPKLLAAPTAQPDPQFQLVMHWVYRVSAGQVMDATRRWRKTGAVSVQGDVDVVSTDLATIKSANDAMVQMLVGATGPGAANPAAVTPPAPVGPAPAAASEKLSNGTIQFTPPAGLEENTGAKTDVSRDYVSTDHATEVVLTVLPGSAVVDSRLGPTQLATAKRELASVKTTAGPEIVADNQLPVAIHWSFDKDGKPAQAFRLFRKVGKELVRCEVTTTADPVAAQQLGEQTLLAMTSSVTDAPEAAAKPDHHVISLPPHPTAGSPSAHADPKADFATKMNQRAQAALDQAKKMQTDGHDDQAYSKYKFILNEYPRSTAASAAQQAVDTYEADAAFMAKHAKKPAGASDEDKASAMLAMADNYATAGRIDDARAKYQEVLSKYPATASAAKVSKRLVDLEKAATRPSHN